VAVGIKDQSFLQVHLDGKLLPLEVMRVYQVLATSHYMYYLPMGALHFLDPHDVVAKLMTVSDGTPVQIAMGRNSESAQVYDFRIFNCKNFTTSQGTEYKMTLIDPADEYRLKLARGYLEGSSSEAIKQIAALCGIKATKLDTTNDTQIWYPMNEPYQRFAHAIAALGYAANNSCMYLAMTSKRELRYLNASALVYNQDVPHFVRGIEAKLWVTDSQQQSQSGTNNQSLGYAATSKQHSVVTGAYSHSDKVSATHGKGKRLNMNPVLSNKAGGGKLVMRPIDSGNNHANALAAKHQNARLKSLMSNSQSLLTPLSTTVEVLDPVQFSHYALDKKTGQLKPDDAVSGFYMVAGKTAHIGVDLQYNQRIQLIRNTDSSVSGASS
jgi:hypothetical protein